MSRELVVLSHLRWTFVWQRPQHLIQRLASRYDAVWFVEEPMIVEGLTEPRVCQEVHPDCTRLWLELPADAGAGFTDDACERYAAALEDRLDPAATRHVWMYTPMALETARALAPDLFVYDVMDDLAAFRFAPEGLVLRRRHALRDADIVFTGGRSLYRGVMEARAGAVYCFPSGVEPDHYAPAREWRAQQDDARRRVAGYVGVIDERVDLDLVAGLAEELDDWEVRMVGPLAKLSEADLPRAGNLTYPGPASYAELPRVMAGFDVALMPFALNEATRSISPTKTLEYLAAGLPVVSTRVPDVVGDHSAIVQFADNAAGFAVACRRSVAGLSASDLEQVRAVLQLNRWDAIAARMGTLLDEASGDERLAVRESA